VPNLWHEPNVPEVKLLVSPLTLLLARLQVLLDVMPAQPMLTALVKLCHKIGEMSCDRYGILIARFSSWLELNSCTFVGILVP